MSPARDIYVIITAAGSGTRMGTALPKQFVDIGGIPVLRRTIEAFRNYSSEIRFVLVLPEEQKRWWLDYCRTANYYIGPHVLVSGGITRYHSVKNALAYVPDGAVVAVHDGVRPFPGRELLDSVFQMAETVPAIVPAVVSVDTLRQLEQDADGRPVYRQLDRSRIYAVQTPQVFHSELLKEAYGLPFSEDFTDDASVVSAFGVDVKYIKGSKFNIKLTTPDDLVLAQAIAGIL